jgi:acetyl-CoA carboxylase biotin carboxyl carrier protein
MDIEQIKELMTHLEGSKLRKMVFKKGDFELRIEKEGALAPLPRRAAAPEAQLAEEAHREAPHAAAKEAPRSEQAPGSYVTSPMVGTHYTSPGPGQPSFVKVGDKVTESTVVCIIEAMKVMNEVKAGVSGTVAEILADNSQPVEFGSRLLRIV